MLRWDFAKSAEAMFSRWAIKRVCKFLLKKRLGDYILGDIDLDQLDVQLGRGTIQLTDLALNVDFLNHKLGGAPVIVKEGSIASLSIKIPWKMKNCQIEVEELELVLASCGGSNLSSHADSCIPSHDGRQSVSTISEKLEQGKVHGGSGSVSLDVHEGVKTIAKIVKWFLTSFNVRLKNLIVAFDPCSEVDEKRSSFHRTLVLRIAETEYGTCVSEDATTVPNSKLESFLGMGKLTNFIKFHNAVVEFLQMDEVDNEPQAPCPSGTSFSEFGAGCSPSNCTTTVLTGASSGFSGTVNLSIPWKNGSLDVRKVDADIFIDPVELRLQPQTIKWIIFLWESLENVDKDAKSHVHYKETDSICLNARSRCHLSTLSSAVLATDKMSPSREKLSSGIYSPISQETQSDAALLPGTHVIHNWVPISIKQEDHAEMEPDYGASLDQFFECFDGMRSSQASLSNSGIWNWTCSVFSAITAASSLASGSGHVSSEQQHSETNVKATIAAFSVVLSLCDEQWKDLHKSFSDNKSVEPLPTAVGSKSCMNCISSMDIEQSTNDCCINQTLHYLEARCRDMSLALQIFPQKVKFEATVRHIKVKDYFSGGKAALGPGFPERKNYNYGQMLLTHHLQDEVQGVLPPFPFSASESEAAADSVNFRLHMQSLTGNAPGSSPRTFSPDGLVKVDLLESFGVLTCQYSTCSSNSSDRSITSASFSVKLPLFILWVDFSLVNMLSNLFEQVGNSLEKSGIAKDFRSDVLFEKHDPSSHEDVKSRTRPVITTMPPRGSLKGNIVLPQARIVLCFPLENHGDFHHLFCWDKFLTLEFSPQCPKVEKASYAIPVPNASSQKGYSYTPSTSIHLDNGNLDVYLVTSASRNLSGSTSSMLDRPGFSSEKIISVTRGTDDHHSGITLLWQKGPVTGPWMVSRAWSLATSQDPRSRNKVTGKGYELASVTTAEDREETNSRVRQEMILSSGFFMCIRISLVRVNIRNHEYKLLYHLLNQVMNGLSCRADDKEHPVDGSLKTEQSSASHCIATQASFLLECDALDLCITFDEVGEASCSIQNELPGSWNSLSLRIEEFELLSVSNIGGISDANFLWVRHGQGELWGSIIDMNDEASVATQDFLLITCRNSTMRRGDGEGGNVLSSGSAGTFITHLRNPQPLQSFTSITVRCGTVIAPGGRLDWFNAITLFFSLPAADNEADNGCIQTEFSDHDESNRTSFCLDLVDIALCYDPYIKNSMANGISEESGEQYVSCLLAAASLNLSNQATENVTTNDYKIQLQDIGLLICESSGSINDCGEYHINYLQKAGYVKVAGEALVEAVLRINSQNCPLWEVEFSESHVNLDTCHDTTLGLVHLVAQLQQIFAPDMGDAVVHLQSRWNSVQQAHGEPDTVNVSKMYDISSVSLSSYDRSSLSDGNSRSIGLMDEILDDAFYFQEGLIAQSDSCDIQSDVSLNEPMSRDEYNLNISIAGDIPPVNISFNGPMAGLGLENIQTSSVHNACLPQFIESYYISELLPRSKLSAGNHSSNEVLRCEANISARKDVECGKGGWYEDDSLMIVENHISETIDQSGGKQLHLEDKLPDTCKPSGRLLLKNIDVRWRMYAGSDWPKPRKNSPRTSSSNGRDDNVCLELTLSSVNLQYDMYPDGEIFVSKLSLSIQDFHLYDCSRNAPWKMVLGYYHSKDHPRESSAKAFKLDLEAVRPDPLTPLEEYRLHLAFLPMRLHLDQGQVNFLMSFFGKSSAVEEPCGLPSDLGGPRMSGTKRSSGGETIIEEALLPFFQKCDIWPVVVRVDYIPHHIDLAALRGGNYVELINLVPWKGIELQLKHVHAVGVYGWSSVCETVIGEWLEDISQNQVPKVLKGLTPIRSLFAVSSGAAKLVSLPVKNYRKDRRLLKGIQRGAIAFVRSISLEAVGLGVHLASGAHDILLQTECILTSIPPSLPLSERSREKASVRSNQPEDAQQGILQAYESLSDGIGKTASALVGAPLKTYQRGAGAGSALVSAVRAAPAAAIAPASAAARAAHCALLGLRNSLDREHKKESMEKYLGSSWSRDHRKDMNT